MASHQVFSHSLYSRKRETAVSPDVVWNPDEEDTPLAPPRQASPARSLHQPTEGSQMLRNLTIRTALTLPCLLRFVACPCKHRHTGALVDMQPIARMPLLMPDDFSEMNLVAWRVERGTPDPQQSADRGRHAVGRRRRGHSRIGLQGPHRLAVEGVPGLHAGRVRPREDPWKSDNGAYRRICLFESADGVHWTRPELSNVSVRRTRQDQHHFRYSSRGFGVPIRVHRSRRIASGPTP